MVLQLLTSPGCFYPSTFFWNIGLLPCPLCQICIVNYDILQGGTGLCNWSSLWYLFPLVRHLPPVCLYTFWKPRFKQHSVSLMQWRHSNSSFLLRFLPEASFALRMMSFLVSVYLCVRLCVCVCQTRACPRHNPSTVQARITKFGPEVQTTLVNTSIVLGVEWP